MTNGNASSGPADTSGTHHRHGPRMRWAELAPEVFRAMLALDAAARKGLDPALAELVRIRASQLNKCAFCLDRHISDARKAGETEERIHLLNAWEEAAGYYTEREQAALALTEAVTVLAWGSPRSSGAEGGGGFVPDAVYDRAAAHLDEAELARLIALITTINAWNRFGVTTRMVPGQG